jgi:hypothetical protein
VAESTACRSIVVGWQPSASARIATGASLVSSCRRAEPCGTSAETESVAPWIFADNPHYVTATDDALLEYNRELRDLIISGRAKPSFIVSHELGLDEAPEAYQNFDARLDGWTKVLLHPSTT